MPPSVSGNLADDEASDDSRSGFDSYDSRDYASDSPGNVSRGDVICQGLARFAAKAMQFEDCMLDAMASAPPAEAPKVETHAATLESEPESQNGDAEQLDALDGGTYEQCAPIWGGTLGSVRREWGQPSFFFVMKIQILEIVILKIDFLTQSTLKI
jgi:hypothetical protein